MRSVVFVFIIGVFLGCQTPNVVPSQADAVLQYTKKVTLADEAIMIAYLNKALIEDDSSDEMFFVVLDKDSSANPLNFTLDGKLPLSVKEPTSEQIKAYRYSVNPWYQYKILTFANSHKEILSLKVQDKKVEYIKYH